MSDLYSIPQGVLAASLTPLNADLSINIGKTISHCRWLLSNGSDGLALLGTTGEANSFSVPERMELAEKFAASDIPIDKVMVGTGMCALPDTISLTKQAVELGYGGVLMLPPFYYNSPSEEGLLQYFDRVIEGVQQDGLKIYLYHIPQITGVPFSLSLVQRLCNHYPNIIVGMKDSGGDVNNMKQFCAGLPGFQLYAGTERYLLDVLNAGGMGCISATANVTSAIVGRVYDAWKREATDLAKLQQKLLTARTAFEDFVFVSALKSYMAHQEQDTDWLHVRPPNTALNEQQLSSLIDALAGSL